MLAESPFCIPSWLWMSWAGLAGHISDDVRRAFTMSRKRRDCEREEINQSLQGESVEGVVGIYRNQSLIAVILEGIHLTLDIMNIASSLRGIPLATWRGVEVIPDVLQRWR
eukprot:GFKZ01003552.1.p2 GENE.GFKZ01003552.1~~GFKZ01003552.1.p2  ORF type:complete len:111 (+),score=8.08 GFKZ01003552.1:273-605(+)